MVKIRMMLSAALAVSLLMLSAVVAVSASAHTPKVDASCDELSVALSDYKTTGGTNHVTVTIDGAVVADQDFGRNYSDTFDAPDKYKAFSYVVKVTAWDDPNATKGYAFTESGTSTPCQPPATPQCVNSIPDSAINAYYTSDVFHARVTYIGQTPLCAGVSKTVSLNSYQTEGPTWTTSGTQTFIDHDQITIDGNTPDGYLEVKEPSCYYQTDLYFGSTRYDGVDGALPHWPDSGTPLNVITSANGGTACQPEEKPKGSFTDVCTATGAEVTIGNLDSGDYEDVVWTLTHGSKSTVVHQGDKVAVDSEVALDLSYTAKGGKSGSVQTGTSAKACPVVVPPAGEFTTECTATGAQADVGTLTEGSATRRPVRAPLGRDRGRRDQRTAERRGARQRHGEALLRAGLRSRRAARHRAVAGRVHRAGRHSGRWLASRPSARRRARRPTWGP